MRPQENVTSALKPRQLIALFALGVSAYLCCLALIFPHLNPIHDLIIAPIMSLGSFVAGATFLGGGAVAFPALTKILSVDPTTAKTFSLAIQSVGMTSASAFILYIVKSLPFKFIGLFVPSSCIGLWISLETLEDMISPVDLRIGFTLFILCFFCIYLWTYFQTSNEHHFPQKLLAKDTFLIGVTGLAGGIISGLIGSGADLFAFCLLALHYRINIRLATQASVIIMASLSIVGTGLQGLYYEAISDQVLSLWVVAAPVVVFGAPIGAYFCARIHETHLLAFISIIVLAEVISTSILVPIEQDKIGLYSLIAVCSFITLYALHKKSSVNTVTESTSEII